MTIRAVNPATGETIEEYPETPPEEVDRILHAADAAFHAWRRTSVQERAARLREAARLLRERAPEYARLMALEMGKPIAAGRAEAEKCALACDYYAQNGPRFLEPEMVVCLGATAAQALLGPSFRVTKQRGQWLRAPLAERVLATIHPSAILRAPDEAARHREFDGLVADLSRVRDALR